MSETAIRGQEVRRRMRLYELLNRQRSHCIGAGSIYTYTSNLQRRLIKIHSNILIMFPLSLFRNVLRTFKTFSFLNIKFCREPLDGAGRSNSIWHYYHMAQADWFFILYQQPMSLLLNIQILAVAVLQKASTFPSSICIDLIRVIMCAIWGLFHICYMCSSSISYMLTAACCGCISKSQYLLSHSRFVSLEHKSSHMQHRYICSNSQ